MTKELILGALIITLLLAGCIQQPPETPTQVSPPLPAPTPTAESPSLKKYDEDWIVSDNLQVTDKTIVVGGDLIVKGTLVLQRVKIRMDSPSGTPRKIEVMAGGRLKIYHSTISSTSTERGYNLIFRPGSEGLIENSVIEQVQANKESFGTGEVHKHANLGGLTILADGFILRNSIIRNATRNTRGILVAEAANVLIEGNTISNSPRDGVRVADCAGVTLRANRILNNGSHGIKMMNCRDSRIEDNVISGNCYTPESPMSGAIFLEFGSTTITVSNNEISNNGRHGMVISAASRVKVHDNTISGSGAFGIYLYGSNTSENEIYSNKLSGNRLEGIYVAPSSGKGNAVSDNDITFPLFDGIIANFEKAQPDDYFIWVVPDSSAAKVSFSFPENSSYDGSRALKLDYVPYTYDCSISIFGDIGQDWSKYQNIGLWVKPDENIVVELEFEEADGDVWFYSWRTKPLVVDNWNKLEVPLSAFTRRQRSIGDGTLNLRGIGRYRLSLAKLLPHSQPHTIFFDNICLGD